ncbi:hypothetical protein V8E55_002521 [Tylopilus felleus]
MNPPPVINALPCVKAFVIRIFGLHVFLTNLKEDGPSATPPVRPQPQRLSRMDNDDYNAQIRHYGDPPFLTLSLISGWKFNDLDITLHKDARGSLLDLVNTFEEKVYMRGTITKWVSDFTQRCLSSPKNDSEGASNVTGTPLLREWAKATLMSRGRKDALDASIAIANFTL